ncbi:Mitogen-activated protein kinase 7 [Chelonia mydas]|uniref:NAD(P)(+)--arginine ADP-ribosyltransferase n=1 Tax=Chelonia mydas TaxID=8469 RepID=M7AJJ5_CHEMY|nr:Mitogen-activated protein kinase 7 [Chelonia mydas]
MAASPETAPPESPDITMVTQQLSKSQVEDLLPPVFSVTPKGSGAGYGVGFDLEEFLNQSFDMVGENRDRFLSIQEILTVSQTSLEARIQAAKSLQEQRAQKAPEIAPSPKEVRTAEGNPILNLASNSLDDVHRGWVKAMKRRLPSLLEEELEENQHFHEAWDQAKEMWLQMENQAIFP